MPELTSLELMDRLLRRYQKLPPAGTKRKIPEPSISPPLISPADSMSRRRQLFAEMSHALITSTEEVLRQADEILAKQQQGAHQHIDMEQG
jgi:hypothetical protein